MFRAGARVEVQRACRATPRPCSRWGLWRRTPHRRPDRPTCSRPARSPGHRCRRRQPPPRQAMQRRARPVGARQLDLPGSTATEPESISDPGSPPTSVKAPPSTVRRGGPTPTRSSLASWGSCSPTSTHPRSTSSRPVRGHGQVLLAHWNRDQLAVQRQHHGDVVVELLPGPIAA